MELYDCITPLEKELREIDLTTQTNSELEDIACQTVFNYEGGILEDERIVVAVLEQITKELLKRLKTSK